MPGIRVRRFSSAAQTAVPQVADSATNRAVTLLAQAVASHGNTIASMAGARWLARQVFTATAPYTPSSGATTIVLRMVGGGGGGGGGSGGANTAAASGGASGSYLEFVIDANTSITGGTASVGLGGAGGTGSGNGTAGGDSSITINGALYLARGGGGGNGQANTAAGHAPGVGRRQAGSTTASAVAVSGEDGDHGISQPGSFFFSGGGGGNPLGSGAGTADGGNPGTTPLGFGGGGSGGCAGAVSQPGGAGAAGVIIIDEYLEQQT